MQSCFIFYVADQARSAAFHASVPGAKARLDVTGMTEFALPSGGILRVMPQASVAAPEPAPD